jgi:hypothetical protein
LPAFPDAASFPRKPLGEATDFRMSIRNGPPEPAGTRREQLRQSAITMKLSSYALQSVSTQGRRPTPTAVTNLLAQLKPSPPLPTEKITETDYRSHSPSLSPERAYRHFVENPGMVFESGRLEVRPVKLARLYHGARLFLEDRGPPPTWMPVLVHLAPERREITITTLDGHPLRGVNIFQFLDDGRGGTFVHQRTRFQGSSALLDVGVRLLNGLERQHGVWDKVHGHLRKQGGPETPR